MRKPQVVPDEDHEVVYERVAAVDVAKASGVVCLRTPDPGRPGRYVNRIWDNVPATRVRVAGLGRELLRCQVQMVTLESTSDYWRIWYYVLESAGLAVQLVSALQARNLKGRPKTGKLDAMWLARLTQSGLLDRAVPVRQPVRHPARQGHGQGRQRLRPRRGRAGRHRCRRPRHLPRRTVRPHRPPPWQGHRTGRRGPLHHDHRLAPAVRPPRPLPRPRPGLLGQPHQPGQEDPHPPPGPASSRRHRHHHRRRAGRLDAPPEPTP